MSRIMISGTHSGCGKTTVTLALLKALTETNIKVDSFKCGPDYIDPIFHSRIIGTPSHNLDSWFCGGDTLNYLLQSSDREMSLIEGVMGFYDGVGKSFSSCDTALAVKTPVVLVVDSKGMSGSLGAVMKGFLTYRNPNNIVGFIFNRLPESLVETAKALCEEFNTLYLGHLPFDKELIIESRHLGLAADSDIALLKAKIDSLARLAGENILIDKIIELSKKTAVLTGIDPLKNKPNHKAKIAVSKDEAFSFLYRDNLDFLRRSGCEVEFFSPLHDRCLPENINGMILVGGYPELYAKRLSENKSMLADIKNKISSGVPTIAECGGFMYLHESFENADGKFFPGVGAVSGRCFKTDRLQRFGYVTLTSKNDNLLCKKGQALKAHEFHYWDSDSCGEDFAAAKANGSASYSCVHCDHSSYFGFPHLYFYANVQAVENFIIKCEEYGKKNG